jgi:hypothetical protein
MNPAVPGKPLPVHPTYGADKVARAFWRSSFRAGRLYLHGLDATGQPILVKHERETPEGYARRQRITKPRKYVGPILRRYNDFVWRLAPVRDSIESMPEGFMDDVDGEGTSLDVFMRETLLNAQVERESYILLDAEGVEDEPEVVTKAQADAEGRRPILRRVDADSVVWWQDECGALEACIVVEGARQARYYDDTYTQEIAIDTSEGGMKVKAIGAPVAHGYDGLPIVRLRPAFDPLPGGPGESQASPIAESQQGLAQLLSLLMEETHNVTFTQWVATGVSPDELKDMQAGSNRVLCIPNPNGKMQSVGADPAQAKSIQDQIQDETANLFRVAGVNFDAQAGAPESGIAKAFRFNDLAANLAALAGAVETAENRIFALLADAWSWPAVPSVKYADDFNLPDFAGELESLTASLVATEIPATIRRKLVDRFAARNLTLTDEERAALDEEMDKWTKEAPAGGAMPGAPRPFVPFPPAGNPASTIPEPPGKE